MFFNFSFNSNEPWKLMEIAIGLIDRKWPFYVLKLIGVLFDILHKCKLSLQITLPVKISCFNIAKLVFLRAVQKNEIGWYGFIIFYFYDISNPQLIPLHLYKLSIDQSACFAFINFFVFLIATLNKTIVT